MTGAGSAGPADTGAIPDEEWDLVYRPKAIITIVAVAIAIVIVIHLIFGLLLNISYTGVNIGWADKIALISIGLVISASLLLFTRSRLRVGSRGVEVRNLVTERCYEWDVVQGLAYPEKGPWARLLFAHDEHIPVMAVQARDGARAVEAMRRFRELHTRYTAPPKPTAADES
ncbi:hypothetical protein GOHSU_18_00660 [Gordonia hirsuta DSM 44140 = NBRC 16056]|uniref:Low molecular weight protein antigen 6 PH domain-containing protein n=1 Tax=Gordonia hirsuta DSM 44140 = NBRC 16056 TaxID=1121927 RepID=L7L975_9ACTN|nr:PH domain-containing protein [Gordonia hirsuta]GAC57311.1 hypothetical protein GOHSU_18_00660 [Gordonia hirsuta DSM 44140 = NBRC 16056]